MNDTIALPLPNDDLLLEKERNWRLKLPESFKQFLKKYNGCSIENNKFHKDYENYAIARFLCILKDVREHDSGWSDISVVETQIGERLTDNEDLIGIEVLPIAELITGDYLCFDYRIKKENPDVCVWSNDESGDFNPVTYYIADTFESFLDLLY